MNYESDYDFFNTEFFFKISCNSRRLLAHYFLRIVTKTFVPMIAERPSLDILF